jgi:hypothetical protein
LYSGEDANIYAWLYSGIQFLFLIIYLLDVDDLHEGKEVSRAAEAVVGRMVGVGIDFPATAISTIDLYLPPN